ncbi:hypothetical protein [Thiorhodococcus fuscus]|uniref:Uncharacterized protein n=1 Tax=Thiorhodococcus fuscus TaxID=527200 RepID=A0ABW4Y6J2_9GAMM
MGWQHKSGHVSDTVHNPFLSGLQKLLFIVAVIAGLFAYGSYQKGDGGSTLVSGAIAFFAFVLAANIKHTRKNTREYR